MPPTTGKMEMTYDLLDAMWIGNRGSTSPVRLMGFRGGLEPADSPNATGIYDDLIAVLIEGSVTFWKASVDPSTALIKNPINPDGAAQLCPGIHLFTRHLMHGKYLVLGQSEDVHVNRLRPDGTVREVQFGDFGICIHSGGSADDTQRFSAGCQIIHNPDGYFGQPTWDRFFLTISQAMAAHQIASVPYMLTEARKFSAPSHLENV